MVLVGATLARHSGSPMATPQWRRALGSCKRYFSFLGKLTAALGERRVRKFTKDLNAAQSGNPTLYRVLSGLEWKAQRNSRTTERSGVEGAASFSAGVGRGTTTEAHSLQVSANPTQAHGRLSNCLLLPRPFAVVCIASQAWSWVSVLRYR